MNSGKTLRRACVAGIVVGLASCALPEITIDPSLEGQGASAGSGSNDGGKSGNAASAGKGNGNGGSGNGSSGSANPGGDGGSDDAGGGTAGTSGGSVSDAGKGGSSGGTAGGSGGSSGGSGGVGGGSCSEDLTSDEANCGQCGLACEYDQTCTASKCTGPCGATFAVSAKGFVTAPAKSACMHGLAFIESAVSETSHTPESFTSCGANCKLCISGSVGPDDSYGGYAAIIVALNETSVGGKVGTVAPTGGELEISVTNTVGNPLRLWIWGKDGQSYAEQRWCYELGNKTATHHIPWGEFNTECWTNTGIYYDGAPLKEMQLHAPGDNNNAVPYNFCLNSFKDY